MSFVSPETPNNPDCVFSSVSTSDGDNPSLRAMTLTIAGSRSPDRVPMTSPSSGVIPIEVSMETPALMAAAEQPFPQMKGDDVCLLAGHIAQRTITEGNVAMRCSVKSVASNAMPAVEVIRNRIQVRLLRDGVMK